jgi:hypothetical protein
MTNPVAEVRITPLQIIPDLFGVWIQQELMVVKAVSVQRIIRTVDAVTVQQSGARFGQIAMPNLVSLFLQGNAMQFSAAAAVEQAQLDFLGVFGEDGEVHSFAIPSSS